MRITFPKWVISGVGCWLRTRLEGCELLFCSGVEVRGLGFGEWIFKLLSSGLRRESTASSK